MEAPSPRYIITRAVFILAVIVAALYAMGFVKKLQRRSAIVAELKSIASDSSFFHQFYAADAGKTLVRAVALIAEANELGMEPDRSIDGALGIERKYFAMDEDRKDPPARDAIIRNCLRTNYENFRKLGYTPDFHTLEEMKTGKLPHIPAGPQANQLPEVSTIIDSSLSPGLEKVVANLEIRPPGTEEGLRSDVAIAAAKRLATELAEARIIEEAAKLRILEKLDTQTASPPKAP